MTEAYQPAWNSLAAHPMPEWFRGAKFGIYTHWGVYSVPACGPNATWYPYNMYREGTEQHRHHVQVYGGPEKFGYKDFIPQFTAEKFDPDAWADLFLRAGARFAGPVGEHHDGFCMWNTRHSEWNAARMGPRRDVVGELAKAIRSRGLKYMVALHHAENWWFFPHWRKDFDTSDPRYAGLYGDAHNPNGPTGTAWFFDQEPPSRKFLQAWQAKTLELIDNYQPDMLWFDFGLGAVPERYKQEMLAHYYNQEARWGRPVVVTYKYHDLPPNVAVMDLELGREGDLTYHQWITDSTVDDGQGWGYLKETGYKTVTELVHYLVDNVSKNGHLLLNVGPRPDGTIPPQAVEILEGMGRWLDVNGEAIYDTTPWTYAGEGPTRLAKSGAFNEDVKPQYTPQDIRYTAKGDALYAICLAWPGESTTLGCLKSLRQDEVKSVTMLGSDAPVHWRLDGQGLTIHPPSRRPCEHAYAFKIVRG